MATQEETEAQASKQAIALMDTHRVSPAPENYAVWFLYAQGKHKELIADIDKTIAAGITFTREINTQLHHKHIVMARNQRVLDETALTAQKLLQQVLNAVNGLAGEQQNYSQDVDQYLNKIGEIDDEKIQATFQEVVAATKKLKESGQRIHLKFEESKKEITSLKKDLQQVSVEAQRDFLTGVFNRKTFESLFNEQSAHAQEEQKDLSLLMVDIDYFKRFNDKFGHLFGDEVLKIVAHTLTEILKGRDIVARFGGEEFVIMLPNTPMEGAMKVAEQIRAAIAGKELKRKDTGENYGKITVSIGASHYRPKQDTLPSLIKRADDALYQSKQMGRNRVTRGGD